MGGRGRGGGGGGSQTARAVASALGIARHEMANFTPKLVVESPPLYPVLKRTVLPLADSSESQYMTNLKAEIADRFVQSKFFLDNNEKKDIRRYIDKYNQLEREKLRPDFSHLPEELCWMKEKRGEMKAKRAKLDESGSERLQEKLKKLEEKEGDGEAEEKEGEEGSDSDGSERAEPEAVSEDEGEEDNDYISNYFDNGEGYGDAGSDDNMDGEEY